jgi:hypothetical protein
VFVFWVIYVSLLPPTPLLAIRTTGKKIETGLIRKYYCLPILFFPITMVFHPVISLSPVACGKRTLRLTDRVFEDMFSEGIPESIYMYTGEKLLL